MIVCVSPHQEFAQRGCERGFGATKREMRRYSTAFHRDTDREYRREQGSPTKSSRGRPVGIHPAVTSLCPQGSHGRCVGLPLLVLKTPPLLFLLLLLITKTLGGFSPSQQLMNEPISAASHVARSAVSSARSIISPKSIVSRRSTLTNCISCKCQQFWSRSIALVVN